MSADAFRSRITTYLIASKKKRDSELASLEENAKAEFVALKLRIEILRARLVHSDGEQVSAPSTPAEPPILAEACLRLLLKRDLRDAVLGDLQEDFAKNLRKYGYGRARFMYWVEVLRSAAPLLWSILQRVGFFGLVAEVVRRFHIS